MNSTRSTQKGRDASFDAQKPITAEGNGEGQTQIPIANDELAQAGLPGEPPALPSPANLMPSDFEEDDNFQAIMERTERRHDEGKLVEATAAYLDFSDWPDDAKQVFTVMAIETVDMPAKGNSPGGPTRVVKLIDKNRMSWISAAKILVSSVSNLDKLPAVIIVQKLKSIKDKNYTNLKVWVDQ